MTPTIASREKAPATTSAGRARRAPSCCRSAASASSKSTRAMTPNAPSLGSRMISSRRWRLPETKSPSAQSAKPSRCRPPVSSARVARAATAPNSGPPRSDPSQRATQATSPRSRPTAGKSARPNRSPGEPSRVATGITVRKASAERSDEKLIAAFQQAAARSAHNVLADKVVPGPTEEDARVEKRRDRTLDHAVRLNRVGEQAKPRVRVVGGQNNPQRSQSCDLVQDAGDDLE